MKNFFKKTPDGILIPISFIGLLWIIHIINSIFFNYSLNYYGIHPRDINHLTGIIFAPFLHGGYEHIISNTFMLILFSFIICFYDKKMWYKSIIYGTLIGGFITWCIGSNGIHVGASILIFSLLGTILGLAIFHKKFFFIFAALIFFFFYGISILQGFVPKEGISLAGHLGGLIGGIISARKIHLSEKINL